MLNSGDQQFRNRCAYSSHLESGGKTFDMLNNELYFGHEGFPLNMVIPNDNALDLPFHEKVLYLFISYFFRLIGSKHTL